MNGEIENNPAKRAETNQSLLANILVLIAGLGFLLGGIFGYTGLSKEIIGNPERDLVEEELFKVVETLQIWYTRPLPNGGNYNFINADFNAIGLSDKPGSLVYNGNYAQYRIDKLTEDSFDIMAVTHEGERVEVRNVGYDTRPQPVWLKEKVTRKYH